MTIHACFLCVCTEARLSAHCEGHFEDHNSIPCEPCPRACEGFVGDGWGPCMRCHKPLPGHDDIEHFRQADFDSTMFCAGCAQEGRA